MLTQHITTQHIDSYLASLKQNATPVYEMHDKLKHLQVFIDWLVTKGYMTTEEFKHLENHIANLLSLLNASPERKFYHFPTNIALRPLIECILNKYHVSKSIKIQFIIPTLIALTVFFVLFSVSLGNKDANPALLIKDATTPGHIISFQGKLTDGLGNTISDKTDIQFNIYTQDKGGKSIYQGGCQGVNGITPDIDGSFKVDIGKDCDMKSIPTDLLVSSTPLYLGVTIGTDTEMQPRKKLTNVQLSADSQTLQGLPVGYNTSSIPFINESGDMLIEADNAAVRSVNQNTNFTMSSAKGVILQSAHDGDITLQATDSGSIVFKTGNGTKEKTPVTILHDGSINIMSDLNPTFSNIYNIGSISNQWSNIYTKKLYQDGYEVCDSSNNCSPNGIAWSALATPQKNLSLQMNNYTSTLTFGGSTGTANLFNITDTSYNTGTGYLVNIGTSPGSQALPFHVTASGSEALSIMSSSYVGVGTTSPIAHFQVEETGTRNKDSYAGYFKNTSTNSSTDGINKYGAYISSTGSFAGNNGTNTNNYGMYIATTSGADNNYDIYAASGAYLSTGGTWTNASSRDLKTNFENIDVNDILTKINQLDLQSWNYKKEDPSIRHVGPIAEQFYDVFHVGENNKSISTIDPAGIALAGIQALNKKMDAITQITSTGDIQISSPTTLEVYSDNADAEKQSILNSSYLLKLTDGNIIRSTQAFSEAVVGKLSAGLITARNVVVDGVVSAGKVTTTQLKAINAKIDTIETNVISSHNKVTSPLVETSRIVATEEADLTSVKTNQIAPLNDNIEIQLNNPDSKNTDVDQNKLASLLIKGLDNQTVTTIDAAGNITTTGSISAQNASISGTLATGSFQTEDATISGQLIADSIKSKDLDSIRDDVKKTSSSLSEVTNNINDVQKILSDIRNDSVPTNYNDPLLTTNELLHGQTTFTGLNVTDNANIYKASISDSLSVGNLLVRDSSILSLSTDFSISSLSTISFFDNLMVLNKMGTVEINGTLVAHNGVHTNELEATDSTSDISVKTSDSSRFTIKNTDGHSVASIDDQGTASVGAIILPKYMEATSSAAIIAASQNFQQNGLYSPAIQTQSQTAGVGMIPAHENEVTIYNNKITDTSLVYVTQTTSTSGNQLTVVRKESCNAAPAPCRPYFTIATQQSTTSPISFNWLIIN